MLSHENVPLLTERTIRTQNFNEINAGLGFQFAAALALLTA